MGLLDDAIRDHLELKRLRGADPVMLDREQREALTPALSDEETGRFEDVQSTTADLFTETNGDTVQAGPTSPGDPHGTPHTSASVDVPNTGQETAELDMLSVLGDNGGMSPEHTSPKGLVTGGPPPASVSEQHRDEDALGWEVEGAPSEESPADTGQQVPYTQGP